jgi:hypothetical protein
VFRSLYLTWKLEGNQVSIPRQKPHEIRVVKEIKGENEKFYFLK